MILGKVPLEDRVSPHQTFQKGVENQAIGINLGIGIAACPAPPLMMASSHACKRGLPARAVEIARPCYFRGSSGGDQRDLDHDSTPMPLRGMRCRLSWGLSPHLRIQRRDPSSDYPG
jgi:hypothetical protein